MPPYFRYLLSPFENCATLHLNNVLYPRIFCHSGKFDWNWPHGSGEVKTYKVYEQTDGCLTTCDQKSLLEPYSSGELKVKCDTFMCHPKAFCCRKIEFFIDSALNVLLCFMLKHNYVEAEVLAHAIASGYKVISP